MKLDKEIENLQYQIEKVNGVKLKDNVGNRLYGLGLVFFGSLGMLYAPYAGLFFGGPLVLDGIGDLITGRHHSLVYEIFKLHPKYELERILK